jgi:hypothetical protein
MFALVQAGAVVLELTKMVILTLVEAQTFLTWSKLRLLVPQYRTWALGPQKPVRLSPGRFSSSLTPGSGLAQESWACSWAQGPFPS